MPLVYSKKKVVLNRFLEVFAWLFFWPRLLVLHIRPNKDRENTKYILLVEPFGIGDILSLSVMLDPLLSAFPHAEILLLTKKGNEDVYAQDPRISRVYTASFPWSKLSGQKGGTVKEWVGVFKTCRVISRLRPDIGLDTRSEIRSQILMVLCNCRCRVGFTNYLNTNINVKGRLLTERVDKSGHLHRYDMNRLLLASGLNLKLDPMHFPSFKPELIPERLINGGTEVLFHVGARWRYRQWPVGQWAELGRRLRMIGIEPYVIGSVFEEDLLNQISNQTGLPNVLADMERLIRLVRGCNVLVCLDSGPMHLAQTLGIPVVALFGPGDFDLWHPRGMRDRVVFHRLSCNPCLQKQCERPNDGCMEKISVDEVYEQVMEVLKYG
ncbi:MAG: glycosyltransferase family 9 protein [Pontiella sp.]